MLSQDNDISLHKLFQYPLAPIPSSIATSDGSMVKMNKAQLMRHLEAKSTPCSPPSVESCTYVVYGNAVDHSCVSLPVTFPELALQIFHYLPKSKEVHFVTDSYHPQSIKLFERSRRGQSIPYFIVGPKTRFHEISNHYCATPTTRLSSLNCCVQNDSLIGMHNCCWVESYILSVE